LDFNGLLMQLNVIWHYNPQLTSLNHYYAFKFKSKLKYLKSMHQHLHHLSI